MPSNRKYDMILMIDPEHMTCSTCTRAAEACVTEVLKKNKQPHNITVRASFKKNHVVMTGLIFENEAEKAHLYDELKNELSTIGFECVDSNITRAYRLPPWLLGVGSLSAGTVLMAQEHTGNIFKENKTTEVVIGVTVTVLALYMGSSYFRNAFRKGRAMDTLITLATVTALLDSWLSIIPSSFMESKTSFFSVPLMVLGFLKISHALRDNVQARIEMQTDTIEKHRSLLPTHVKTFGQYNDEEKTELSTMETESPIADVSIHSIIQVQPNETVPIDGKLLDNKEIDISEAFLYGSLEPKRKRKGETIFAGTKNTTGEILKLATICLAEENQIGRYYQTLTTKPPTSEYIQQISRNFLQIVLGLIVISLPFWAIFGPKPVLSHTIQVALAILNSACPCGIGLVDINSTVTKGLLLEKGILIRDNAVLSKKITDVIFDKCGTLTEGKYEVEGIITPHTHLSKDYAKILSCITAFQKAIPTEHRTAVNKAILALAKQQPGLLESSVEAFTPNAANLGRGGKAAIDHQEIIMGNRALLKEHHIEIDSSWIKLEAEQSEKELLPIFLVIDNKIDCLLLLKPVYEEQQQLRVNAVNSINHLIKRGINVHILTGDNKIRTRMMADQLEELRGTIHFLDEKPLSLISSLPIINVGTEQLPSDKEKYIKELQEKGLVVAMVGDEINDLLAIKTADLGIAINQQTKISDQAEVILNNQISSLVLLIDLLNLGQIAYNTSLMIAFGMNIFSLSAAAGVFYPLTGQLMDPMISGMSMVASSFLVIISIAVFQKLGRKNSANTLLNADDKSPEELLSSWSFLTNKTSHNDIETGDIQLTQLRSPLLKHQYYPIK